VSLPQLLLKAFLLTALAGCAATHADFGPMSDRRVFGPTDYTVDWDLPETGEYWLPPETEDDIMPASRACEAVLNSFVYHHLPRPPQYSYFGFRFSEEVTEAQKACVVERLKAVPALTIYSKKSNAQTH
jgi:hypothetical protein